MAVLEERARSGPGIESEPGAIPAFSADVQASELVGDLSDFEVEALFAFSNYEAV